MNQFWEVDDNYQGGYYKEVLPEIVIVVEDTTQSAVETQIPVD